MRRLTAQERALWSRVAATVRPLHGKRIVTPPEAAGGRAAKTPARPARTRPVPTATGPRP